MSLKLALALNGFWAISEEAAHSFHNAYLSKVPIYEVKAEDITPDILLGPTDLSDEEDDSPAPDQDIQQIAIISMRGPICQYGYGSATYFADKIKQYANDPSICAIILDINTPGGEVYGTQTWLDAIIAADAVKPVIGFCEDGYVQSAGAWGWSACRERYAGNALCMFGSIGILATLIDDSKMMANEGIKTIVIYAPQSKLKNKTVNDALSGNTAPYEARLKVICDKMLSDVANNITGLTSDEWNSGDSYFAVDAQRIGLINGIMSRADVIARAAELASQNQTQNKMFKTKFTALSALAGVAASAVTAEKVQAVNDQIESEKIEGVTLVLDSQLEALSDSTTKIEALTSQVTAKDTDILGYKSQISAKDQEIAALKLKLAGKPAEEANSAPAVQDTPPPAAADPKIEANSIETQTDRDLKAMRAMSNLSI